jgi:hypothetical protein
MSDCVWCGRDFTPRANGGKAQRFCRPAYRRALDAAARRFVSAALDGRMLTVFELRDRTTRALPRHTPTAGPRPQLDHAILVLRVALRRAPADTLPAVARLLRGERDAPSAIPLTQRPAIARLLQAALDSLMTGAPPY